MTGKIPPSRRRRTTFYVIVAFDFCFNFGFLVSLRLHSFHDVDHAVRWDTSHVKSHHVNARGQASMSTLTSTEND